MYRTDIVRYRTDAYRPVRSGLDSILPDSSPVWIWFRLNNFAIEKRIFYNFMDPVPNKVRYDTYNTGRWSIRSSVPIQYSLAEILEKNFSRA